MPSLPGSPMRKDAFGASYLRRRKYDDLSYATIDPAGPLPRLPRPLANLGGEAVYGAIDEEPPEPVSPTSPSRSPASRYAPGSVAREKNAARQFIWSTAEGVLLRPTEVASKLPVPLAIICSPFADSADDTTVPICYTRHNEEPLRCSRCRCYANPHWKWSPQDLSRFMCNMCGHHVEVPEAFMKDMEDCGHRADEEHHPEMVFGSVDFTMPAEPGGPSQPLRVPGAVFVLDATPTAMSSGVTLAFLDALQVIADSEECPLKRPVSLITYNHSAVRFYLPKGSGRPTSLIMTDVESPFLPCSSEHFFADLDKEAGQDSFVALLGVLREVLEAEGGAEVGSAAERASVGEELALARSAALKLAIEALEPLGGGDVLAVCAQITKMSPASPSSPTSPQSSAMSPKVFSIISSRSKAEEESVQICLKRGVAVSFASPVATAVTQPDPSALNQLQRLSWRTGGEILHLPPIGAAPSNLIEILRHWAMKTQASAYDCVVRLRCSRRLRCESILAPWVVNSNVKDPSAFEISRISPDNTFTFVLKPEFEVQAEEEWSPTAYSMRETYQRYLYAQVVILFRNTKGERLLRSHTVSFQVVNNVKQVFQNISIAPMMALIVKEAAARALDSRSAKAPAKDLIASFTLQLMSTFCQQCYCLESGSVPSLVCSKRLVLLPLLALSARKLLYGLSAAVHEQAQADENLQTLLRMPIHSIMVLLYPKVFPLSAPVYDEEAELPEPLPCSEELLWGGRAPAYLITNGLGIWYWFPSGAVIESSDPEVQAALTESILAAAEQIRHSLFPSPTWIPLAQLPRPPAPLQVSASPTSPPTSICGSSTASQGRGAASSAATPCRASPKGSPRDSHLSWPDKVLMSTLFVEDEGVMDVSYPDWLQFLQEKVTVTRTS